MPAQHVGIGESLRHLSPKMTAAEPERGGPGSLSFSRAAPRCRVYRVAGTITCSIESASPSRLTSTTAPMTHTSSLAVSNLTGI